MVLCVMLKALIVFHCQVAFSRDFLDFLLGLSYVLASRLFCVADSLSLRIHRRMTLHNRFRHTHSHVSFLELAGVSIIFPNLIKLQTEK